MKKWFILAISLFSSLVFGRTNNTSLLTSTQAQIKKAQITEENDEEATISASDIVLDYYYKEFLSKHDSMIDKDTFLKVYRNQKLSINEFIETFDPTQPIISEAAMEIISPDADYILGTDTIESNNQTLNSYFEYQPAMSAFNYSLLEDGDIIYESEAQGAKHVAFLYDCAHKKEGNTTYFQTIEAVASGVQYGFLDDNRILRYGVCIYRVYRAKELNVITRAKNFIINQVGKKYSLDFTKTDVDENEQEWYCSELVFAAYWAGGMNIANSSNYDFDPAENGLLPVQITWGYLNYQVSLAFSHLEISINKYESGKWFINVRNSNPISITLEYNEKMCYEGDAKEWKGLKDIKTVSMDSKSSTEVKISQNFFATTIVFSYVKEDMRYITYANELTKGGYSMSVRYATI